MLVDSSGSTMGSKSARGCESASGSQTARGSTMGSKSDRGCESASGSQTARGSTMRIVHEQIFWQWEVICS